MRALFQNWAVPFTKIFFGKLLSRCVDKDIHKKCGQKNTRFHEEKTYKNGFCVNPPFKLRYSLVRQKVNQQRAATGMTSLTTLPNKLTKVRRWLSCKNR